MSITEIVRFYILFTKNQRTLTSPLEVTFGNVQHLVMENVTLLRPVTSLRKGMDDLRLVDLHDRNLLKYLLSFLSLTITE